MGSRRWAGKGHIKIKGNMDYKGNGELRNINDT